MSTALLRAYVAQGASPRDLPSEAATDIIACAIVLGDAALLARIVREVYRFEATVEVAFSDSLSFFLIQIERPSREVLRFALSSRLCNEQNVYVQCLWWCWVLPLFRHLMQSETAMFGRCLLNQWDEGVVPGLAMCANDPDILLIPDNMFLASRSYEGFRAEMQAAPAWAERKPCAIWRGTTTGWVSDAALGWRSLQRVRLCQTAAAMPDLLDAGISLVAQFDDPLVKQEVEAAGLTKPAMPARDFAAYKLQIDIDGNTNAWSGLFQKLLTGSAVLKVASPKGYRQWYYDRLQPWRHYIPVRADMSDLRTKLEWALKNQDMAQAIGENGRALALSMSYERELDTGVETINRALRIFR